MNAHTSPPAPDALEAEQALLGAVFMNNDAYHMVADTLEPAHFCEQIHALIYEAFGTIAKAGKSITPVSVKPYLPSDLNIGGMTGSQYLASLAVNAVTLVNVPDFAAAIRFAAMQRAAMQVGDYLAGLRCPDELSMLDEVDACVSRMAEIRTALEGKNGSGTSFADAIASALDRTEKAHQGSDETGIDYGVPAVARLVGRLTPGQLVIIGGGTKQGKSALAQQMAVGAARNGWPVYTYSGEMGADELAMREISRETGISVAQQKSGRVSQSEYESMLRVRQSLGKLPWQIQDKRRTLDQLERELEAFVKRNGPCLVVVDSVTLIERDQHTRRMSNWEFAEVVTDRLKSIARKLESSVIALSQLKKNTFVMERPYGKKADLAAYRNVVNRRPRYSDILGACERDADHVIIPFNPEPILSEIEPSEKSGEHMVWQEVMEEMKDKAQIILALSREQRWPRRQDVRWNGATTTFSLPNETGQGGLGF